MVSQGLLLIGVVGALTACALVGALRCLFPPPLPLAATLAALDWLPPDEEGAGANEVNLASTSLLGAYLGRLLRRLGETAGMDFGTLRADLALMGRPLDAHMGAKALFALGGLLLPGIWSAGAALAGISAPVPAAVAVSLVLAVAGYVVPDAILRSEAAARRRTFRQAFGSFLDLVVIGIHGGSGVEAALMDAARVGRGWAFAALESTLEATDFSGQTPWAALQRLGDDLAVPELAELAASISLAGTSGARVGASVAAKATAIREREIAEAEAKAEAATERLAVPTVMMMAGFVVLIGFPALYAVITGV